MRSIPACAGEPAGNWAGILPNEVYPRVCGGTRGAIVQGHQTRVYPRVCGGTFYPSTEKCPVCGLSPRVRGNPLQYRQHHLYVRSIPACAGEPCPHSATGRPPRVYPRVCGGTQRMDGRRHTARGLSPRVRGNPVQRVFTAVPTGSIPACAGEPPRWSPTTPRTTVYPRVCGGTARALANWLRCGGLSPRVRGNLIVGGDGDVFGGSIPACAGEPPPLPPSTAGAAVYPRVCGGTLE